MKNKLATKQAKVSPISGTAPPEDRQFGKKNGNPRHNGAWRKKDTPRYKLERMITLPREELEGIIADEKAPEFERGMADIIMQIRYDKDGEGTTRPAAQRFQAMEKMINQVYGQPAQTTVNLNTEMDEKEKSGFIKGVFIPKEDENV